MDEESKHMSTRVMGTFGYVAPEYAMTGHLLVKSDVYSYGVVLLELLTGRRPVDMSRSPGQENLVTWGLPFLTSNEGLESIIDPSLGPDISFDSVAKVAAIASMCVQPEVSNRPFMGEVVQALKLICNECDEARRSCQDEFSIDMENRASNGSRQLTDSFQTEYEKLYYEFGLDHEKGLSTDMFGASERVGRQDYGSFRRFSSSGPLITGKGKQLLEKVRRLYGGSIRINEISTPYHSSKAARIFLNRQLRSAKELGKCSFGNAAAITSPVPDAWYPTLAVFMLAIGLVITASFFIYEATSSRRNRSLAKELSTGATASVFLDIYFLGFMDEARTIFITNLEVQNITSCVLFASLVPFIPGKFQGFIALGHNTSSFDGSNIHIGGRV
ncbi:hypothetical protein ACFE04_015228 [Oxalis oulophora]